MNTRVCAAFDGDLEKAVMEHKKHVNGYIFDSLVYRYKLARQKALEYDLQAYRRTQRGDEACLRNEANRDLMRFIEILDEGMREHD